MHAIATVHLSWTWAAAPRLPDANQDREPMDTSPKLNAKANVKQKIKHDEKSKETKRERDVIRKKNCRKKEKNKNGLQNCRK